MHIIISGATGFIGQAVVKAALARGHAVSVLVRNEAVARKCLPANNSNLFFLPFGHFPDLDLSSLRKGDDALIHLAWEGVGKYSDPANLTRNLEPQFLFLKGLVDTGLTNITVAGSCLEYGLLEGAVREDMCVQPVTYYGLAKHTLRCMLDMLANQDMKLKWLRCFYVYGKGQRPQAILPQLLSAIERGDKVFNMSKGEQVRDFIHVDTLAFNTILAAEAHENLGILNMGSGHGTRVIDLVRHVIEEKGASIELNPGYYPYPSYEPFAFQADTTKLKNSIKEARFDDKIML
ncbi:MAG: hypothetical protein A2018_04345 [Alphaproteobacteria bacterium GWF2_58_20]|nr:MAG: hypothetical protein A2018_04345 [Alphaproteobacteria bacterium GWF2_58_20]